MSMMVMVTMTMAMMGTTTMTMMLTGIQYCRYDAGHYDNDADGYGSKNANDYDDEVVEEEEQQEEEEVHDHDGGRDECHVAAEHGKPSLNHRSTTLCCDRDAVVDSRHPICVPILHSTGQGKP